MAGPGDRALFHGIKKKLQSEKTRDPSPWIFLENPGTDLDIADILNRVQDIRVLS